MIFINFCCFFWSSVMVALGGGAMYFCWMKKTTPINSGSRLMPVKVKKRNSF